MKYLTEINWGGIDYVAPLGYYFLDVGDSITNGDGFLKVDEIEMYYIPKIGKIDFVVKAYQSYPSVLPIPVEKAPAPAKLQYKLITYITVGDLFISENKVAGAIITVYGNNWEEPKYSISGLYNSLNNYSNCQGISKKDMLEHLNNMKYIFITNINDKIKRTFEAARKLV